MNELLLCLIILLTAIVFCSVFVVSIVAIYFFIVSSFMHYPPPVPSSGRMKEEIMRDIRAHLKDKEGLIFTDLGSGWGTLLIPLAKQFPQHRFIGIERAFLPYIYSKFLSHNLKNISFIREDMFKIDISRTDIVYCFLMQPLMNELTPFLKQNMKHEAIVYSCRFKCPNWIPQKTISLGSDYETYYVYKKD